MTEQTTRQEILAKYADDQYLTADEMDELGISPQNVTTDEMRDEGWIFRLTSDEEEVTGYLVENMDSMEAGSILYTVEER